MANLYRVLNGNWNATNSWATTSGGTGSVTTPTSADNCYFDANSPTGTTTVNTTANCLDLDFTGYTGTFAGSSFLNLYGNIIYSSGMTTTYSGSIVINGTISNITSNGKIITNRFFFTISGKTGKLLDDITLINSTTLNITNGGFDANGKTVTLTGNTGTILGIFTGSNAFYNLVKTGVNQKTESLILSGDIEVTNNLTINGNSSINRLLISSSVKGTTRTITCNGTITVTNADFQDITGAGTGSWNLSAITGGSGDCGGNSGITFTTPVTTTCSAGTTWSTATWSSRVPLPQDSATFSGSSRTITQDMPRIGSVDFTGSSGLTWTTSTACSVFGSINLTDLVTLTASTQDYTFEGRGSNTLNCGGKTWEKNISINCIGGTFTLTGNYLGGITRTLTFQNGTFDADIYNLTCGAYSASNIAKNIYMGSGIWEMNGNLNFSFQSLNTVFGETSTIKLTGTLTANRTFAGGGKTYNNFWNATTGAFVVIISGSNTFNDIKTDGGRETQFTQSTTQTVTSFTSTSSSGNLAKLRSTTTTNAVLAKAGGGTISLDYMDVDYITGSPVDTWYMGANSTDGGHNSNVYFTVPPTVIGNSNFFMFF